MSFDLEVYSKHFSKMCYQLVITRGGELTVKGDVMTGCILGEYGALVVEAKPSNSTCVAWGDTGLWLVPLGYARALQPAQTSAEANVELRFCFPRTAGDLNALSWGHPGAPVHPGEPRVELVCTRKIATVSFQR
eukprot:NODE_820_length_2060_cov_47.615385_g779_i0.p1 GENE.NODE_820_length_2060_cov_47.615385_g779_i0~~NODE_820_length_2060_cov_47.615385_g779_i0.p1  ORF type:complete len:134 (+),score=13.79 NODE_820_length_2060_cov_47.615385_g779_i0:1429-1830(+)